MEEKLPVLPPMIRPSTPLPTDQAGRGILTRSDKDKPR